jgi:hypothetical protein
LIGGVEICFEGEGGKAVMGGKIAGVGDEWIPLLDFCEGGGDRFKGEIPFLLGGRLGVVSPGRNTELSSCGVESKLRGPWAAALGV